MLLEVVELVLKKCCRWLKKYWSKKMNVLEVNSSPPPSDAKQAPGCSWYP